MRNEITDLKKNQNRLEKVNTQLGVLEDNIKFIDREKVSFLINQKNQNTIRFDQDHYCDRKERIIEELKERLIKSESDVEHYRDKYKHAEVELSSLKHRLQEGQLDCKAKNDELNNLKQLYQESESGNKILHFRIEKSDSTVAEAKSVITEYKTEIENSQQRYQEIKRISDNTKFLYEELSLHNDQNLKEV